MKLYDSGVYLVNGKEIMTDAAEVQQKTGKAVGADGCFHFFSSPLSTTSCPVAADS